MVREMCGVQLKYRRGSKDVMFMLGLSETMNQLAMASSVCWYGHVLRRADAYVLRRTLDLKVEGQGKKWRLKRTWNKQAEEESVRIGLRRED